MKRIIVCVMSTALLTVWSAITRAEMGKQRPTDGGDIAEAIAEGDTDKPNQRVLEMLFGKGSGKQSLQPRGTTQPWQTSWEAFCAELKRLYSQGVPPPDEINALFAGKQVTWEGHIAGINEDPSPLTKRRMPEGARTIRIRMPDCRVTVGTGAAASLAEVLPLDLIFENQSEMNQSLKQIGLGDHETWLQQAWQSKDAYELFTQKVRFTATLEPLDLEVFKLPPVSWEDFTDKKEGFKRKQISIYTSYVRLFGPASSSSR